MLVQDDFYQQLDHEDWPSFPLRLEGPVVTRAFLYEARGKNRSVTVAAR